MSAERPTFSPLWHRVRALKPRLRPHVQVTRQHYRGRRWHVVHDPSSNHFYRLSPVGYEFVGLLDGRRTVEEVWNLVLGSRGDAAPTQPEVIEMIGQMYSSNLLSIDTTPETEQLLSRGRERLKKKVQQQAIGIMYFRIRVFNPDRYLAWIEPLLRPLLNRWGFLLWCAWILLGLYTILPHFGDLTGAFQDAIAPANWIWLALVFVVIKAIHETGHGVICKRFGGQVPEMGVMLLVLFPAPYVDASSAWTFRSKWQRVAVGAGGMIFELAIAALAALIWVATQGTGSLLNQLAYNAMVTASISTLLFNANPLMRFDGYYILSDLLEVPNLMQRSNKMLQYLFQKYMYFVEQARPPSTVPGEKGILLVYGVAALAYRIFLFFAITLYVMGQLFAIGLVLAIWTAAAWFLIPIGKFTHWLGTSSQLAEFRPRAIATSILLIGGIVVGLGTIRAPDHRRASGVVESVARSGVYVASDGFVTEAHVQLGDTVKAGDPILTCMNPELEARLEMALAGLAELETVERQYLGREEVAVQEVRRRLEQLREEIAVLRNRIERLVIRAPHDGVVVTGLDGVDPQSVLGVFVRRGQGVCEVVDVSSTRITATLTTEEAAPLIRLAADAYRVQLRPVSNPYLVLEGRELEIIQTGRRRLPHPALGAAGGGTHALDAQDRSGMMTREAHFDVRVLGVSLAGEEGQAWLGAPGERIAVRFSLPRRPLLWQWTDRLHRLIQGRIDI
jgi:putative peptide zinc metalloprotease protein